MLLNVDPGHAHLEKPVVVSGRRLGPERPDLVVKNLPTEGAELGTVGDKISTNISSQESSLESRNSPCYVGHFGSEREDGPTESRNMGRHLRGGHRNERVLPQPQELVGLGTEVEAVPDSRRSHIGGGSELDERDLIILYVTNRGGSATVITTMVLWEMTSWWQLWRL
jgi:hypothetical protein